MKRPKQNRGRLGGGVPKRIKKKHVVWRTRRPR